MLKANGKYKESNVWMSKFSEMKPYDTRAIAFRNTPNYLDKIIKKGKRFNVQNLKDINTCLLYTSPSPRDATLSRMPSSA